MTGVCPECEGRGMVPATPGQPGDGPEPCPSCSDAATIRERLAGMNNTWLVRHEIAKAQAMAATASEEECQAEFDRLCASIESRICAWRYTQ